MKPPANWHNLGKGDRLTAIWSPASEISPHGQSQAVYKLHGSVNWRDPEGNQLMVMGGNKPQAIGRQHILRQYLDTFKEQLEAGGTRLMVIGYGFNDSHINNLLVSAALKRGMKMHLVNPLGTNVLKHYPVGTIRQRDPLEEIPLIGVTVRTVREAFSGDKLSQRSLYRFFS